MQIACKVWLQSLKWLIDGFSSYGLRSGVMARLARIALFAPDEVAIVHVMNRVVRRCFLLGDDPLTGKNYDHRKVWIEDQLRLLAAHFGIDVLGFAILSNHFHLILRSRPDCVEKWDDTEVARRWLMLCPIRKDAENRAEEPNEMELNTIRNDPNRLKMIRSRLSDISWWMRLLCQQIAVRANQEDSEIGKFFQSRYRAVRLLDESAILACAAYVDLNPIRAAMSETLESSDFTSVQRRIQAVQQAALADTGQADASTATTDAVDVPQPAPQRASDLPILNPSFDARRPAVPVPVPDRFLSPVSLDERNGELGAGANQAGFRCSDKGYLPMSFGDYLKLLDWTGRQLVKGKRGRIPNSVAPILRRLKLDRKTWCELVSTFGRRFFHVAGQPTTIDATPGRQSDHRYYIPSETRDLFRAPLSKSPASAS
jgi:hypothetical protein